jgi:peptidoglycan/LPS O-acetylase OafA/YrhL
VLAQRKLMRLWLSAGITIGVVLAVASWQYNSFLIDHNLRLFVLAAFALPFLFDLSRRVRIDRWLGELSYPIYLIHLPVIGGIWTAFPTAQGDAMLLLEVALTLALSAIFVIYLDTPFEAWRQRRGHLTVTSNASMRPYASQKAT